MSRGLRFDPEACQEALAAWLASASCPGVTATLLDGRGGAWSGAVGHADAEGRTAMAAHAPCYIYSITKSFTAVRVLQLVEEGAFALDDPITAILRDCPLSSGVTIRCLLNHTAGVPSYTSLPDYEAAVREHPAQPWSQEKVLARTCRGTLEFVPGSAWRYSNTGYLLLKMLIESASRKSYADNIREHIAVPLGLRHTRVACAVDDGSVSPGYWRGPEGLRMENIVPRYHPAWCLTGLIISTTSEVAGFYSALFAGRLLSQPSLTEMQRAVWIGSDAGPFFRRPSYGLGLMIDPDWDHGGLFGHGGGGPGFNTWAMHLPGLGEGGLTMAIFCNASMDEHPFGLIRGLLAAAQRG